MFALTPKEKSQLESSKKLWNYYNNDFVTDYPKDAVQLPMGRTIKNTLVYDNWISKTVNRYAAASVGKYGTVEIEDPKLQELITVWHEYMDFESKLTSIARYQGLYGYAVVKLVFNVERDEEGAVVISDKNPESIINNFDIAVFGADNSLIRYDEYGNISSIIILMGNKVEVFYKDIVEVYVSNGQTYKLQSVQANPVAPMPLAFAVKNLETGIQVNSDVSGIVSLQEALNDALTSLRLVNHYHGFPIYTATGVDIQIDEAGNPRPLVMGAGMTLQSESSDTSFSRVEMPAITPLKESIESLTKEIAVSTNSLSLLTGQIPSGTALSYMMTDFNSAVEEKQMKLRAFITKLHKTVFALLDYAGTSGYTSTKFKALVSGHNPLQKEMEYQQAKELYALGTLSKRTLLDNSEAVGNTEEELARLKEEGTEADSSPLSVLRG